MSHTLKFISRSSWWPVCLEQCHMCRFLHTHRHQPSVPTALLELTGSFIFISHIPPRPTGAWARSIRALHLHQANQAVGGCQPLASPAPSSQSGANTWGQRGRAPRRCTRGGPAAVPAPARRGPAPFPAPRHHPPAVPPPRAGGCGCCGSRGSGPRRPGRRSLGCASPPPPGSMLGRSGSDAAGRERGGRHRPGVRGSDGGRPSAHRSGIEKSFGIALSPPGGSEHCRVQPSAALKAVVPKWFRKKTPKNSVDRNVFLICQADVFEGRC